MIHWLLPFAILTDETLCFQWLKLDELIEQERQLRQKLASRAGVLALLLHSAYNHDVVEQMQKQQEQMKQLQLQQDEEQQRLKTKSEPNEWRTLEDDNRANSEPGVQGPAVQEPAVQEPGVQEPSIKGEWKQEEKMEVEEQAVERKEEAEKEHRSSDPVDEDSARRQNPVSSSDQ